MINASVAASAFFSAKAVTMVLSPDHQPGECIWAVKAMKPRRSSTGGLQVIKASNAQGSNLEMINGSKVMNEIEISSSGRRNSITILPDWSTLLAAAITNLLSAAERHRINLEWMPKPKPKGTGQLLDHHDQFGLHGHVYRRTFEIRSYEVGPDRSTSILTVMCHLQEAAINLMVSLGLVGEGFGTTREMCKRDLIWVVTRMHVVMERYPTWGDIVEVETWLDASGKNGVRRDWIVRDSRTGQILTRATSVWVMMNKYTRRLSKIPEEIKRELEPAFNGKVAIMEDDNRKIEKFSDSTADYIQGGLTPRWRDLDVNQHVNNVKYIGWILESAPESIFESHDLSSMTLEYRRECKRDGMLRSLTALSGDSASPEAEIECEHLLQLESGPDVVRARTKWRPKRRTTDSFSYVSTDNQLHSTTTVTA